ncbi:MAG TPA: L-threonylcarbamoyladenylate synthase, partial [Dehalococcoidia bacterium]|nr:L-threonylcarbamoyladenylate synthase [Dehalococcoidia bacterium]
AEAAGEFTPLARALALRFWPGPLTLVVRRKPGFESAALAGSETVALRQPAHAIAQEVLNAFGGPLTGTSANRSGGPDPVSAQEVMRQIGDRIDLIIDGGECPVGVSSTIVDCTGSEPVILREGAVSREQLVSALAG